MMLWLLGAAALAQGWPDIDQPLKTGAKAPADAALVIGIEDYYEVPTVPYAKNDAQAFRDFLVYSRGISPSRIELLFERSNTSAGKIRAAAKRLGEAVQSGGTAWVYFAGHGAASPKTSERLLMGVTTSPDAEVFEEGTVKVEELEALAGSGGGKVLLVLDTCYAGAGVADLKRFAVPSYALAKTEAVGVWTAAGPNQLSGPIEGVKHGAFTYFVIGALRGWADGVFDAPDGEVTAEEAQEYVVKALLAAQIREQTPVLAAEGPGAWTLSNGNLERGPDLGLLGRDPAEVAVATVAVASPAPAPKSKGKTYSTNGLFQSGKAKLAEGATALLQAQLAALKGSSGAVKIEVHTDNIPLSTARYASNVEFSQARADGARSWLIEQGVRADRITAVGYGADHPVSRANTDEGRSQNRRLVFVEGGPVNSPAYQGLTPVLTDALFAAGSARLAEGVAASLQAHAAAIKSGSGRVRIEVHSDNVPIQTGRYADGYAFTVARANAIRLWLIEQGVDATRLSATGYSGVRPAAGNETREGRKQNRRVAFVVE